MCSLYVLAHMPCIIINICYIVLYCIIQLILQYIILYNIVLYNTEVVTVKYLPDLLWNSSLHIILIFCIYSTISLLLPFLLFHIKY